MAQLRILVALVASLYFFFDLSLAFGKFSEKSRQHIKRNVDQSNEHYKRKLTERVDETSKMRFYNKNTTRKLASHQKHHLLTSQSLFCQITPRCSFWSRRIVQVRIRYSILRSLLTPSSGLVPIKKGNNSRELFFAFQPTVGAPVDEITIWLNGGPGCSSLEGFFQENGRFIWPPGTFSPMINEYSCKLKNAAMRPIY